MDKKQLKEILNNKDNWKMFERLANNRELVFMPEANLDFVDLRDADLSYANLRRTKLNVAKFGERELINKIQYMDLKEEK